MVSLSLLEKIQEDILSFDRIEKLIKFTAILSMVKTRLEKDLASQWKPRGSSASASRRIRSHVRERVRLVDDRSPPDLT
jgi:hypothetical protein